MTKRCLMCQVKITEKMISKMGLMAKKELKIISRCTNCQDKTFIGEYCQDCNEITKFSELNEINSCKICKSKNTKTTGICLYCKELICFNDDGNIIYGTKICKFSEYENNRHLI
jgi:hypothetical protein